MKKLKYVILVSITAVTAMFSMLTQGYIENSMHEVEVFSVEPVNMENVVVCSGSIEYSKKLTIDYDENLCIDKCHVKTGDKVKEGDLLFSATETAIVSESVSKDILEEEMYAALASGDLSVIESLGKSQVTATSHSDDINGEKIKIYSPYTGVITSIKYEEDDAVSKGSTIAVISPHDSLQVVLSISESQISDIKIGQPVTITGAGFKNSQYSGIVESIAPYAEQTASAFGKTTTVEVTVAITNPDDDIKSGFTAKCSITVSQEDNCIALPYEYIGCDDNGSEYVLVYDSGFARKKYISTGNEYVDCVQVLSGVSMSDRIITKPAVINEDDRIVLKKGSVEK